MSSAEDADDERESAAPTPIEQWVDPKSLKFTVFIVLPNDDVCTLRDLPSGISVPDLKARLELQAGLPSQLYNFFYPNGDELREDQKLVVHETILNGYLLKVHIHDNWETLYLAVSRNCIEQVYHSGGVHLKGNIIISSKESDRYDHVVRERGTVALFMASSLGLQRMANMLISVGVRVNSTTPYGRAPLHAAVAKDHMAMVDFLLNNGASLQQADKFGVVPLALAKQLSSSACFRKLRIMQLNLRGSVCSSLNKKSILSTKNHSDARADNSKTIHIDMTHCTDSSLAPKHNFSSPIHASRKHLSASAPLNESGRKVPETRDGTYSSLSNATTGKIRRSKGNNVKWKDTKTEYVYWKNVGTHTKTPREVEETVKVKPMALAEPKAILKYSNIAKQNSLKADADMETNKENEELVRAMQYSKNRLKHFKKLATPPDGYVPIAYRKKNQESLAPEHTDAFKNWLDRKTIEFEEAEENKSSSEEYFNQSDPEEDKMVEFNKRVRKKNREAVRYAKSAKAGGNRPVPCMLQLGSTTVGDSKNPPAEKNMSSYKEWRRNRASCVSVPRGKSANDFIVERRRLEEKRQKLLMNAISYEEWLYHTEERKMLIKQILKADFDEMRKLEVEKFKDREKLYSYDLWTERLQKRETEDKRRKEIQRKYDEERLKEKMHGRKSGGVNTEPFDEWLNTKRFTMSKENERQSATGRSEDQRSPDGSARRTPRQQPDGLVYNDWLLIKRQEEIGSLDDKIANEHTMNGKLTNLPTVTMVT